MKQTKIQIEMKAVFWKTCARILKLHLKLTFEILKFLSSCEKDMKVLATELQLKCELHCFVLFHNLVTNV